MGIELLGSTSKLRVISLLTIGRLHDIRQIELAENVYTSFRLMHACCCCVVNVPTRRLFRQQRRDFPVGDDSTYIQTEVKYRAKCVNVYVTRLRNLSTEWL